MRNQTTTWDEIERLDEAAMMTRPPTAGELTAMAAGCPDHGNQSMNYSDDGVHCMGCAIAILATAQLPQVSSLRTTRRAA